MPSVFSTNAPHSLRVLIVVPVVCIFCGLALSSAYNFLSRQYGKFVYIVLIILFLGSGYYELNAYFNHWANDKSVKNGFDYSTLALLQRFARLSTTHLIFMPQHLIAYPSATFLIRTEKPAIYAQYNDESFVFPKNPEMDVIYVFSVQDTALGILEIFRTIYPQAEKIGEIMGPEPDATQKFCELYLVKRSQLRSAVSPDEKTQLNSVLSKIRINCESTPWLKDQLTFCYERRKWQ
ncbi:MAG: hypothetical protein N2246_11010 [Candidatus Sumerlaeia bacterium]|nr:hypothetical protein [Candidatus Sumerlaeia bacterium]